MDCRNVVHVTTDSLRGDHCEWLNENVDTTPSLDSMASDSLVFENAIAPGPRTPSSVPVFQTGEHFARSSSEVSSRTQRIREHVDTYGTVATEFASEEYTTVAFSVNPWTFGDSGFADEFDRFVEVGNDKGGWLPDLFEDTRLEAPAQYLDFWLYDKSWFCTWHTFFGELTDTISDLEAPFYIWIFLMDTHNPFLVPSSDREESSLFQMYYSFLKGNSVLNQSGQSAIDIEMSDYVYEGLRRSYRDSIRSVDRFVDELRATARDRDPVLIFHSDHGEAFGEHGTFGHQQTLYEENIRVPLLVYNVDNAGTVTEPFGLDELPRLLLAYGTNSEVDPDQWGSEYTYARSEDQTTTAVRGERWKLIDSENGIEFYDLREDPEEQSPIRDTEIEARDRFEKLLKEFLESLPTRQNRGAKVEDDENIQELLSSLGYLEE